MTRSLLLASLVLLSASCGDESAVARRDDTVADAAADDASAPADVAELADVADEMVDGAVDAHATADDVTVPVDVPVDVVQRDGAADALRDVQRDGRADAVTMDAVTVDVATRPDVIDASTVPDAGRRAVAVSAYYAAWMQDAVPPSVIDFASLTQIHHFSLVPRSDGTLDATENVVSAAHVRALVAAAHGARRKALISVGGAGTLTAFRGAWSDAHRSAFVAAIVRFAVDHGYDGVDVDVEPMETSDAGAFQRFVRALRSALDAERAGLLLTAAAGDVPAAYVPVQGLFQQINVMTYDISGPWPGWVTWHNTPLHNGGMHFPGTTEPMPSVETAVGAFISAGVTSARLGIGIDLYGYDWRGASGPLQSIRGVTTRTLSYADIMDTLWRPERARWDTTARVPWLSIDNAGTADDHFISYDDERSAAEKVELARARGFGSVIVWELGGGWRASQPAGSRDVVLRAIGRAASGG